MTNITYTHKKWLMAVALLGVLGLNVSFNPNTGGIFTDDFASSTTGESRIVDLETGNGKVEVTYTNISDTEVRAVIPRTNTEGRVCNDCGVDRVILPRGNGTDLTRLNERVLAFIRNSSATERTGGPARVREEDREARRESERREETERDYFEQAFERCDARNSERSDKMSCLSGRFVEIIKRNHRNISREDALKAYRQIETMILAELRDARAISVSTLRASLTSQSLRVESGDPDQMRQNALTVIRDILEGMPSKFENVRSRLLTAERSIVAAEATELQRAVERSRDPSLAREFPLNLREAQLRERNLTTLMSGLLESTSSGLDGAVSNDFLSVTLRNSYMENMDTYHRTLMQNYITNPASFMGATGGTQLSADTNLAARIANPGRLSILPTPGSPGVMAVQGGTPQTVIINGQQMMVVPVQPTSQSVVPSLVPRGVQVIPGQATPGTLNRRRH